MIERIKNILSNNETYAEVCEDWDISSLLQIVIEILKEKKGGIGGEVPKEKVDAIAEMLLPDIIAFFQTEEGKRCSKNGKKNRRKRIIEGCNLCEIFL